MLRASDLGGQAASTLSVTKDSPDKGRGDNINWAPSLEIWKHSLLVFLLGIEKPSEAGVRKRRKGEGTLHVTGNEARMLIVILVL